MCVDEIIPFIPSDIGISRHCGVLDGHNSYRLLYVFYPDSTSLLIHTFQGALVDQMSGPRPKLTRRRGACEECRQKKVRCKLIP